MMSVAQPCGTEVTCIMSAEEVHDDTETHKAFGMAVKTNMLYDALLVPNIAAEIHLGKRWTGTLSWMCAWWDNRRHHFFWRIYGGELGVRKYLGKARNPFEGHHLGICAQIFTYDFETGGTGYMAGKPGGSLFDRANYSFSLEYGYSIPLNSRLSIDLAIGAGYMGGLYYEYKPIGDCYVWQSAKRRHWIGPTKAEVSLVWSLGKKESGRKGGYR